MTELAASLPTSFHAPAIESHRLVSDQRSAALLLPDGTFDWWCAPEFDSPPLLWWLLDADGPAARWIGARMVRQDERPAGPTARTTISVHGAHLECWDGLVPGRDGVGTVLARLVRAPHGEMQVDHALSLGGFDASAVTWDGTTGAAGALTVQVIGGASDSDGRVLTTHVRAVPDRWSGLAVAVGGQPPAVDELEDLLCAAERRTRRLIDRSRLPRHHPERVRDALLVLDACTFRPSGAVIAAPTTSLPEIPGGGSQWDYRYTWLRDASLATSVAALLGRGRIANRYLRFVLDMTKHPQIPSGPFTDVHGETAPQEREVDVAGWAGSKPVRVGNAARDQVQYDALGLLVHSVSVYLQTGGSLDRETWGLVRAVADEVSGNVEPLTNGIWELRDPRALVDADIGRWLALDVALWIARLRHPLTRRRDWKRARNDARERVLAAIRSDGSLPQAYGDDRTDAAALMIPVFGLLGRDDARAHRLVDALRRDLGAGPFLYRFPPDDPDGREGAFLPTSWWVVTALAVLGRYEEASKLADEMCARLPRLLAEEIDPESGHSLGNTPLVWSHMELARAMYVLDAARIRHRWGRLALSGWRLHRYALLRWFSDHGDDEEET